MPELDGGVVALDLVAVITLVELNDHELIEAVTGRLDETSGYSATLRALLSTMP